MKWVEFPEKGSDKIFYFFKQEVSWQVPTFVILQGCMPPPNSGIIQMTWVIDVYMFYLTSEIP